MILGLRRDVEAGRAVADALSQWPRTFRPHYVRLVEVGEATGQLPETLSRLADRLERSHQLRQRVRQALAYPVVVLCVALGATAFLLSAVVPAFASLYADFGADLPVPTRLLLRFSAFVTGPGWYVLGSGLLLLIGGLVGLRRSRSARRVAHRLALSIPIFGSLLRQSVAARTARTLALLLESGVPLVDALSLSSETESDAFLSRSIEAAANSVRQGGALTPVFEQAIAAPPLFRAMIRLGEETGRLPECLDYAARQLDAEVRMATDSLTAALEPALIVAVGAIVGALLVALYLPMFDVIDAVQ